MKEQPKCYVPFKKLAVGPDFLISDFNIVNQVFQTAIDSQKLKQEIFANKVL